MRRGLVAGWACARQQHFVDHVDHAVVGFDVGNDDIGHLTCAVSDADTAT